MKLPRFSIHRPASIAEAMSIRAELGDGAVYYNGGTELLLIMKLGLAEYTHLIDLKGIHDLRGIEVSDGWIRLGAGITHLEVETSLDIRRVFPAFGEMAGQIGNVRVRNSGSLGGNLAFSDPHSDPATFLTAMDGEAEIVSPGGATRWVPVADLATGPYVTILEEGEVISSVKVATPDPDTTVVHRHLRFRERPAVTVTATARRSDGAVVEVRVAVGSVCPVPIRLPTVEALAGSAPGEVNASAFREAAIDHIQTSDDLDGSADYKRHLASEMVARCVILSLSGVAGRSEMPWN